MTLRNALIVLGFAGMLGCQHTPTPSSGIPLLSGQSADKPATLNDQQAADVQIALARNVEKQGNDAQAIAAYTDALQRDPHRADALLRLAILNDRQGKFKESASYYEKALRESKDAAVVHCNFGYSLYLQRRWAESEAHLREAVAKSNDSKQAHNNLALLLGRTERLDEARAEFRRGGSTEAEAHANLGFVLALDGHFEDARKEYQQALVLNPSLEAAKSGMKKLDTLAAYAEKRSADSVALGTPQASSSGDAANHSTR